METEKKPKSINIDLQEMAHLECERLRKEDHENAHLIGNRKFHQLAYIYSIEQAFLKKHQINLQTPK